MNLDGLRIRPAVRALIVTPTGEVLLVRFEFPTATVWALPGGGLEEGETHVDALRRELAEELGLVAAPIGPHIWTRLQVIPFPGGRWDGQHEHVHLVGVDATFDPRPHLTWDDLRAEFVHELRWWTLAELRAFDRTVARLTPTALPTLVETLLAEGPPSHPIDVAP